MKIAILTLGTRGDVQPFVALGQKALKKGIRPSSVPEKHSSHLLKQPESNLKKLLVI